jgi:hypothetical protein
LCRKDGVELDRLEPSPDPGTNFGSATVVDPFLVGNILLSPDARKIPPPTRLGLTLSRVFLASLNVCCCSGSGVELTTGVEISGEGPLESPVAGGGLSEREEMGLRVSFSDWCSTVGFDAGGTGLGASG